MIKSILIENLRGISLKTSIDLNNKSLVIFGENGKGKSSIIDGIEYALTKDIKYISTACREVSLQKHAPNIAASFQDIKVQVEFKDGSIISNNQEPEEGTLAFNLKNSMGGNINILRRSQLLNAIFAQPKERYDMLKQFLPLTIINEYENSLKGTLDEFKHNLKNLKAEIESKKRDVQAVLNIKDLSSVTVENVIKILKNRCEELELDELKNLDEVPNYIKKVENNIEKIGNINYDSDIRYIMELLEEMVNKKPPTYFAEIIFNSINSQLDLKQKEKIVFYEEFLTTGIKWLNEESKSICPFCESSIDVQKVISRVYQRIEENSAYSKIKKEFQSNYNTLQEELQHWQDLLIKIRKINQKINDEEVEQLCKIIDDNIKKFIDLLPNSIQDNIIERKLPEWPNIISENAINLKKKYSGKLLSGDTVNKIKQLINFKHTLKIVNDSFIHINKMTDDYNFVNKGYLITNQFYKELVSQRKSCVQDIYNEIKEDINIYYNKMHPEENIGGLDLKVKDSSSRGSAIIKANFYEKSGEDPRAYYSEAHLDTLGLAIFLALYKRECKNNKELRFLILDDVFTSVDAAHRNNIINLLFSEFKEHQLIITTHDVVLYKEILELEKLYGGNGKFRNIEICDWTKEEGPILDDTKSEFEKLTETFMNHRVDKNVLASVSGNFLELILNKLRYSLELAIPARYGERYTIADIWNKLYSKLRKNNEFYGSNSNVLDDIDRYKFLRNTNGCHYNEWAQSVSKDEIKQLTKQVRSFYELVYCNKCCSLIKKINNNEDYQCNCATLNYKKNYSINDQKVS